ncbi:uncharacterized protein LOC128557481 [Mercenaria mercenaria]|uniref:uncharacterized protein LOC128557481 n=1 Tax=Mercenaria mercenaria TaxID=6596 RepID=UPI00234F9ACB|nr:uncharacterized protein LOC128557481 [Mercenaria mercenaria]
MVENNLDIADLSDPFRPTQLAEKFREIYDEEWTRAFEELDMLSHDESKIIDTFTYLIQEIETFCSYTSTQQISAMEKPFIEEIVNPNVAIHKHQGLSVITLQLDMSNCHTNYTNPIHFVVVVQMFSLSSNLNSELHS